MLCEHALLSEHCLCVLTAGVVGMMLGPSAAGCQQSPDRPTASAAAALRVQPRARAHRSPWMPVRLLTLCVAAAARCGPPSLAQVLFRQLEEQQAMLEEVVCRASKAEAENEALRRELAEAQRVAKRASGQASALHRQLSDSQLAAGQVGAGDAGRRLADAKVLLAEQQRAAASAAIQLSELRAGLGEQAEAAGRAAAAAAELEELQGLQLRLKALLEEGRGRGGCAGGASPEQRLLRQGRRTQGLLESGCSACSSPCLPQPAPVAPLADAPRFTRSTCSRGAVGALPPPVGGPRDLQAHGAAGARGGGTLRGRQLRCAPPGGMRGNAGVCEAGRRAARGGPGQR